MQISVGTKMRRSGFLCAWDLWCVEPLSVNRKGKVLCGTADRRRDLQGLKERESDHERKSTTDKTGSKLWLCS